MPKVVIAEDEFMNLDMIAEVLADSGYDVATLPGRCRKGSNSASGISQLAAIYTHLADCGSQSSPPYELGKPFSCRRRRREQQTITVPRRRNSVKAPPRQGLLKMLTPVQQHAIDQFAKSLPALGDDALIDTYHQAWEDHRAAHAEGSDNLSKAHAKRLATEKAMRDRFPDYQSRYKLRYR